MNNLFQMEVDCEVIPEGVITLGESDRISRGHSSSMERQLRNQLKMGFLLATWKTRLSKDFISTAQRLLMYMSS